MLESYWSFAEGLLMSKKQKVFIIFAISAFLDMICSTVFNLRKMIEINIEPIWLVSLTVVSMVFFLIFCWKYALTKADSFKYKPIYLSVLITLCFMTVLLYLIHVINNQKCVIEIPLMVYQIYTLIRLIFIIHVRCYSKKQ